MKRKLFITLTLCLFAVGAVITTNLTPNNILLEDIKVMAKASGLERDGLVISDSHYGSARICNGIAIYYCKSGGSGCNVSAQPICESTDL